MIHIIWEFQAAPLQITTFEQVYGSKGDWTVLFRQSKEYHGTTIKRSYHTW